MKALVIGSAGYLGRHLCIELERQGVQFQHCDIHAKSCHFSSSYKQIDVTNLVELRSLDADVDTLYMFAGLTGTAAGFAKYADFIRTNELGLLNVLSWINETCCRARVVYPSTRLVYKGRADRSLCEDDEKETKTLYALNKLSSEYLLAMYRSAFDIPYTVFRVCVPFGSRIDGAVSYGTIGAFLETCRAGRDIVLFGDGRMRRTFTHVEDICRIMVLSSQSRLCEDQILNIGGECLSLHDVACMIAEKFRVNVSFCDWPPLLLRLESGDTVFDDGRLRSRLVDFRYRHTLRSSLDELIAFS